MNKLSGILAVIALLTFGIMSPMAFAGEGDKDKDMDKGKGGQVVIYGDDEKKDDGGK